MSRATPSEQRGNAGFTLIEVLVALAVVAASLAAIGTLIATSVRGARAVEQHVADWLAEMNSPASQEVSHAK